MNSPALHSVTTVCHVAFVPKGRIKWYINPLCILVFFRMSAEPLETDTEYKKKLDDINTILRNEKTSVEQREAALLDKFALEQRRFPYSDPQFFIQIIRIPEKPPA